MIEQDTIRLLRECDAGIRMGISSLDDLMDYAKNPELRNCLKGCRSKHDKLQSDINNALHRFHDSGKEPTTMAKGMSWMKTNVKLAVDNSDETVADLVTDGCNMGIKSLYQYLNQYSAANEISRDICKRLIAIEETLRKDLQPHL